MKRNTVAVRVGGLTIGGGSPVSIQSMANTCTRDIRRTLDQINCLAEAGCELVRVAVPDEESAAALGPIKKESPLPVIADVHFDYRLAILAIREGADKVRINPGNIGGEENLRKVLEYAAERDIPLRVGVNAGSISREIRKRHGGASAPALVESALETISFLEKHRFAQIVISLKAADVPTTVEAYEKIAEQIPYPLHLGITEAGRGLRGTVKSSLGIGALLLKGIGDTVRVSLTGDPVEEIPVAREILQASGVRFFGPEIISCPTCGRCSIDLLHLLEEVEALVQNVSYPLKIAVMGCPVNGPGEAREADIGVSGAEGFGVIFKNGAILKKVNYDNISQELDKEIRNMIRQREKK